MRIFKRALFALFLSLVYVAPKAQVANADTMVHKLFNAFKTKDEKAFVALCPNGPQLSKMMRTLVEQMLNTPGMKPMAAIDGRVRNPNTDSLIDAELYKMVEPEAFAKMQEKFSTTFQKLIEKGEKKGVDWSEAKLVKFTADTAGGVGGESAALKKIGVNLKRMGVKAMKGVMDFQSGGRDYQMSFDKIIYLPAEGGWFGGEFPQLARKGESLEPDAYVKERMVKDSLQSAYGQELEKSKTKVKTKSSGVETQKKTTSPARKPTSKS